MSFVKTKELEEIEDIKRLNKARNVRRWKLLRQMIGIGMEWLFIPVVGIT